MDARERWQTLQALLARARALAEAGDRASALRQVEQALELDPHFLAAHSLKERLASADPAVVATTPDAAIGNEVPTPGLSAIEAKVLARRAERRLATASDAMGRRDFGVAAAALDEARELGADPGQLLRIERALADARRPRPRSVLRPRRLVAAATVVVGLLCARYLDDRFWDAPPPAPAATAPGHAETVIGTAGVARPTNEIIKLEPASPRTPDEAPAEPAPATPSRAIPSPVAENSTAPAPPPVTPPPAPTPPIAAPIGPIAAPVEPPSGPPQTQVAANEPARPPQSIVASNAPQRQPASALTQAVAAPAPAPRVAPPTPDDEVGVREALQRYRAAYDQLNARSARAVWPAVDERALARAFDNLSSQQLRFDACDVEVRGDAASAFCRGTATYTPKIGSGDAQIEPRTWLFTLRKDAGQWAIETARVQR